MVGHHQWLSATTKYLLMLGLPCKLPYEDLSSWCERFDFSKSETCNCLPRTILNIFVFFASPFIHMSIFVVALKITYLGVEICQGFVLGSWKVRNVSLVNVYHLSKITLFNLQSNLPRYEHDHCFSIHKWYGRGGGALKVKLEFIKLDYDWISLLYSISGSMPFALSHGL